jgi:hypothetical protein
MAGFDDEDLAKRERADYLERVYAGYKREAECDHQARLNSGREPVLHEGDFKRAWYDGDAREARLQLLLDNISASDFIRCMEQTRKCMRDKLVPEDMVTLSSWLQTQIQIYGAADPACARRDFIGRVAEEMHCERCAKAEDDSW